MNDLRKYVRASLIWQTNKNITTPAAGMTGYRKQKGVDDLFSVYIYFFDRNLSLDRWQKAKIYALVPEMEERLPRVGEVLVVTGGVTPIIEAMVYEIGVDQIAPN